MKYVWTAICIACIAMAVLNGIAFFTPGGDPMNAVAAVLCTVAASLNWGVWRDE